MVFGFQNKIMFGLWVDYEISEDINIGVIFFNLFECLFILKVNIGDDLINNCIYGFDFNLSKEVLVFIKLVDKLLFYSIMVLFFILVMVEVVVFDFGYVWVINQSCDDKLGIVYVDDFEGLVSIIDLCQFIN